MELAGVPTVTVVTERFEALAHAVAESLDFPNLDFLTIPHPFGGLSVEEVHERAQLVADRLPAALEEASDSPVDPSAREDALAAPSHPRLLELTARPGEEQELSWQLATMGLTDGLPVISPTPDRVGRMLDYSGYEASETFKPIPPVWRRLTLEAAAANAVMAGCRPEHFPVVVQAVEALMSRADANYFGMQTTTHPIGPMVLLTGPLAGALGVASEAGCLGPGPWANGAIGRAVRLISLNGGDARPGELDKATMGQPGKFAYCFAENQAASPWTSYREDLGFAEDHTTITVIGAEAPTNINDHGSTDAEGILRTMAGTMTSAGNNNMYWLGHPFVVVGPEHAATLAGGGLRRRDVQAELHRRARMPVDKMSAGQLKHIRSWIPSDDLPRFEDEDGAVPLTRAPDDIHVVVAGGPGKHSMWIPTWFRSVTVVLADANGHPVRQLDHLRRR